MADVDPANKKKLSKGTRRVLAGFGVLGPSTTIHINNKKNLTPKNTLQPKSAEVKIIFLAYRQKASSQKSMHFNAQLK